MYVQNQGFGVLKNTQEENKSFVCIVIESKY